MECARFHRRRLRQSEVWAAVRMRGGEERSVHTCRERKC